MEQANDKQQKKPHDGKHGRRSRGGHRPGAGQEIRTKTEGAYYMNEQPPRQDAPKQEKAGDNAGQENKPKQGGRDRGRNRRHGDRRRNGGDANRANQSGAGRSGEAIKETGRPAAPASTPVVRTAPRASGASLSRSAEDVWADDTFAPLHPVEVKDPEAEEAARRILDAEGPLLFGEPRAQVEPEVAEPTTDTPAETVEVVGVRFKPGGKQYFFAPGRWQLAVGTHAIVETARGPEYGEVCRENVRVPVAEVVSPLRAVLRAATEADDAHYAENCEKEAEAFRTCRRKIDEHGLDMKLVEAQYTFDNSKLLFYFTSDGRVDFRELVKDLAGVFRTRIELRQIGIRDEAKLLGGLGTCGRTLCCAGFLPDFVQVSIKMAKEQNLSLNATKISGCCGRLMCCLRYEFDTYETEIRLTPSVGSTVVTPDGRGQVIANHPLKGTVTVRLADSEEAPRVYHRDTVDWVSKSAPRAEETPKDEKDE